VRRTLASDKPFLHKSHLAREFSVDAVLDWFQNFGQRTFASELRRLLQGSLNHGRRVNFLATS